MHLDAQEKSIYDVQTLKIEEHTFDSIVNFNYIEPYLNGIAWLRQHVKENMEQFPMEEEAIATSRDQNHEAHKRWERYMRTLPVKILKISDLQTLLSIECKSKELVSICEDINDNWEISFENKSNQPLSFEFELGANRLLVYPDYGDHVEIMSSTDALCNEHVNYIGNGRATIFIPPNSDVRIELPVVYSCDGKNGESFRSAYSDGHLSIEYKIKLTGYIYNHDEKELYLVATLFEQLKNIQLKF